MSQSHGLRPELGKRLHLCTSHVLSVHRPDMDALPLYLKQRIAFVDAALDRFVPSAEERPATVHKAMRHSLFAGGKRLRPILCLAAAEACGGSPECALFAACAVECLHTYSLIHDDLPCMDDDDLRRGVPTCHKVYGEAMALLAGDALQALAFELVAKSQLTHRYTPADLVLELARTASSRHLVGGQVADLEGEGKQLPLEDLRYIHQSKTAALLTTSVKLGAMCADAMPEELNALRDFGMATGLAFQIIDDILDVTQTSEKLGKSAGKDVASQKSTYPALLGLEASRVEAHRLTEEAKRSLEVFGLRKERLRQLAAYLLERDY
jgi:geranylgeranyl diphosphate synthase, type II